jgi:1,4-alpha-glucan branching enzyme
MSIRKRYMKNRSACRVTFRTLEEIGPGVREVCLVGEFNGWDAGATPMKPGRDGSFTVTLDLAPDRAYPFRYLVDGTRWVNDLSADAYVHCPFAGCDNSVVIV